VYLALQLLPADPIEKRMFHNLLSTALHVAQPRRQILCTQLTDYILGFVWEDGRKGYPALDNLLVNGKGRVVVEGRKATAHFVNQHTKSPPIYRLAVTFTLDHFWREIFWGTCGGEWSGSMHLDEGIGG
jgi:hypothetical protein